MPKLVTIAIPVYKSLNFLPQALHAVEQQDYPEIELIISDNGMNGSRLTDVIQKHYSKPYKLRQNSHSVDVITHFNQLINAASGDYFLLLCDDDEISPNYVSELTKSLDEFPQASVAISRQDVIDESGNIISSSTDDLPSLSIGGDFIRFWCLKRHGFKCFITHLAKTELLKKVGGYPNFERGFQSDNALLARLCLNGEVAFNPNCTFRWRRYGSSNGDTSSIQDLTEATRKFLLSLDADPEILEFSHKFPQQWQQLKQCLVQLSWLIYLKKREQISQQNLTRTQKLKLMLMLPNVPGWYARKLNLFVQEFLPELYQIYRLLKN